MVFLNAVASNRWLRTEVHRSLPNQNRLHRSFVVNYPQNRRGSAYVGQHSETGIPGAGRNCGCPGGTEYQTDGSAGAALIRASWRKAVSDRRGGPAKKRNGAGCLVSAASGTSGNAG